MGLDVARAGGPVSTGRLLRWLEWVTLRRALSDARQRERDSAERVRELGEAERAVRAADLLLDPPDGGPQRSQAAMSLFREGAHWLLAASGRPGSLQELGTRLVDSDQDREGLVRLPAPAPELVEALGQGFVAFSATPEPKQQGLARKAQEWAHPALGAVKRRHGEVARLRGLRSLRTGSLSLVVAALLGLSAFGIYRAAHGPDLARGKPWRTSSTFAVCEPEKSLCGGVTTNVFFHTQQEDSPWFEVDLLRPERVGQVEIKNRTDFGADRAVPLIVELSRDGQVYWRVAQRTDPFTEWTASFASQDARYVRVRATRNTVLHLERVSVRR